MGQMKDLLITVHNGGDEAVAAVQRLGEDWRLQLEAAAGEVEKLRRRLRLADAAIRSESPTLTDAEREAVEFVVVCGHVAGKEDAATLRGLLERTK